MKHAARARGKSGLYVVWCGITVGPAAVSSVLIRSNCIECLENADRAKHLSFSGKIRLKELRFQAGLIASGAGPSSVTATKVDTRYNTVCKCGKPAYEGFTSFECSGGCK